MGKGQVGLLGEDQTIPPESLVPHGLEDPDLGILNGADEVERPVLRSPDIHHVVIHDREDRPDRLNNGLIEDDGVPAEGEPAYRWGGHGSPDHVSHSAGSPCSRTLACFKKVNQESTTTISFPLQGSSNTPGHSPAHCR